MSCTLAVAAFAWVVMACAVFKRAALMFSSVKEEDSPRLGYHSLFPQEEELDHHGEEFPHWQYLL